MRYCGSSCACAACLLGQGVEGPEAVTSRQRQLCIGYASKITARNEAACAYAQAMAAQRTGTTRQAGCSTPLSRAWGQGLGVWDIGRTLANVELPGLAAGRAGRAQQLARRQVQVQTMVKGM